MAEGALELVFQYPTGICLKRQVSQGPIIIAGTPPIFESFIYECDDTNDGANILIFQDENCTNLTTVRDVATDFATPFAEGGPLFNILSYDVTCCTGNACQIIDGDIDGCGGNEQPGGVNLLENAEIPAVIGGCISFSNQIGEALLAIRPAVCSEEQVVLETYDTPQCTGDPINVTARAATNSSDCSYECVTATNTC